MWNWPTVMSRPEGGTEETGRVKDRALWGRADSRSQEIRKTMEGQGLGSRREYWDFLSCSWCGFKQPRTARLASLQEVRCLSSMVRGGAERRRLPSFIFQGHRGTIWTLLCPKQLPTVQAQKR